MLLHDKETSPSPPPRYSPPSESLLPQATSEPISPASTRSHDQPLSHPLRILTAILNILPHLFIILCALYAATILFWTRNNPDATTTILFSSTPVPARQMANLVLVQLIMIGVRLTLGWMHGPSGQDWAAFDLCVGGSVAVVLAPFVVGLLLGA